MLCAHCYTVVPSPLCTVDDPKDIAARKEMVSSSVALLCVFDPKPFLRLAKELVKGCAYSVVCAV